MDCLQIKKNLKDIKLSFMLGVKDTSEINFIIDHRDLYM